MFRMVAARDDRFRHAAIDTMFQFALAILVRLVRHEQPDPGILEILAINTTKVSRSIPGIIARA